MLNTCDPNLYMEPENPRYPPFRIPPKHYPGPFGWLKRAWHLTDTDILNHATPDELMLLRWFRMLYHWFFGGALFCTPVLMALYYADSQDLNLDDSTRAALGMKRMTIATAHSRYVFWMVVAEMWALSIWLVYLLTRETKGYVRLIWKLGPSKLGIKSHGSAPARHAQAEEHRHVQRDQHCHLEQTKRWSIVPHHITWRVAQRVAARIAPHYR